MSGHTITRWVLVCDSCGIDRPESPNAISGRAEAYAAGWRFVSRLKQNGDSAFEADDVCPRCLPTWTPRPAKRGSSRSRRRE